MGSSRITVDQNPSDEEVITAISCLLKNRGDHREARFGGVARIDISQHLPTASIELASLYYISYLYKQQWQHADGIALWNRKGEINPPGSVEAAFHKRWFARVKEIGVRAARKEHLDPLKETGLFWYGN